ncbi:MAG: hypothetical protein LBV00_00720 [Propionibacteriaceae bacterium]|jgi:hypothetical protein|nr:hypothetical protein [Propionibacteriaceae bacterium]
MEADAILPLIAYASAMNGPSEPPDRLATLAEQWDKVEQVIASCMSNRGFRYTPVAANPEHRYAPALLGKGLEILPFPRLSASRDTVAKYGYGVLPPPDDDPMNPMETEDLNREYQSTLSQAETQAYDRALYGDINDPDTAKQSCSGQASQQGTELPPGPVQQFQAEFGTLIRQARWGAIEGLMESAPAVQLNHEWESCMNGNGVTFDTHLSGKGPGIALHQAISTRPDGTVGPWQDDAPTTDIPVEEKSLTGSEPERALALKDFDCRAQTDYVARLTTLRIQSDNAFIEKNRDALNRLLTAAEGWS